MDCNLIQEGSNSTLKKIYYSLSMEVCYIGHILRENTFWKIEAFAWLEGRIRFKVDKRTFSTKYNETENCRFLLQLKCFTTFLYIILIVCYKTDEDQACTIKDSQSCYNWLESKLINIIDILAPYQKHKARNTYYKENEQPTRLNNCKQKYVTNKIPLGTYQAPYDNCQAMQSY